MAKQLLFDESARSSILNGITILTDAVKATLGPKGRNVIIDRNFGAPTITKDGVTVAKEIELKDPYENMGAQLVREVASKTSDVAGDGTTTATVLAHAIYSVHIELHVRIEASNSAWRHIVDREDRMPKRAYLPPFQYRKKTKTVQ